MRQFSGRGFYQRGPLPFARKSAGGSTSWGGWQRRGISMAAPPQVNGRRCKCAARWRRLFVEHIEPRVLLAPLTNYDQYYTPVNTPLIVDKPGVLGNDNGFGLLLTAVKDTDPTHGTLVFRAGGSFSYTPSKDYTGHDSFTYHANDGQH